MFIYSLKSQLYYKRLYLLFPLLLLIFHIILPDVKGSLINNGFVIGFLLNILIKDREENRLKFNRLLPLSQKQEIFFRIMNHMFAQVTIFLLLLLLYIFKNSSEDLESYFLAISESYFLIGAYLLSQDLYNLYSENSQRAVAIIASTFLMAIIWFFTLHGIRFFEGYISAFTNLNIKITFNLLLIITGSVMYGFSIISYTKRKSYLK